MSAVRTSSLRDQPGLFAANAPWISPLSTLVYQSRALRPLSELELQRLVHQAQRRNRAESLTGLLIYDEGRFIQWLEGPSDSLRRVWQSIRDDTRHTDIRLLSDTPAPVRVFGDHEMQLATHRRRGQAVQAGAHEVLDALQALDLPAELIDTLRRNPDAAPAVLAGLAPVRPAIVFPPSDPLAALRLSLVALVDTVIVPELVARHAQAPKAAPTDDPRADELARLLVEARPDAALALIEELVHDGRSVEQLCASLFEPTARSLGALWQADDCSEFDIVLGLGQMQRALHRFSLETTPLPLTARGGVPSAVLIAPSPNEPHLLGSAIASELFGRAGWNVSCEFPRTDAALGRLVHDRWFDVLDLSLSGVFRREHRLPAMAASIRAAHAQSCNPALTVIVDGRVFHEQPDAWEAVGADGGSHSAMDVVASAQRQRDKAAAR